MLYLEIITPEQTLFKGEVTSVRLPGSAGTFEVLTNHAPLISTLDAGQIRIRKADGADQFFAINPGFVEVLKNKVVVMV
jgi:F-type H+-transporting ATPase subunit epsilon